MKFLFSGARFSVDGIMPERALLKLRRANIELYDVQKTRQNKLLFTVKKKDIEKVFAIYPNVCYNGNGDSPYVVRKIKTVGWLKWQLFLKKRVGFLLGGLLFLAVVFWADSLVFEIELVGDISYQREVYTILDEFGIKPFSVYRSNHEDVICSKLLSLDKVEYCSIKKSGARVQVEIRLSPFAIENVSKESMVAKHTGILRSISVLKGTLLVEKGAKISEGDLLVGNYFTTEAGGQVCVEPIARACIACTYEGIIHAATEEEALAQAYLEIGIFDGVSIEKKELAVIENGYFVQIDYTVVEKINL